MINASRETTWKSLEEKHQRPGAAFPSECAERRHTAIYFYGHFDTEEKCGLKHFTCKRTYCRIKYQEGKPYLFPY